MTPQRGLRLDHPSEVPLSSPPIGGSHPRRAMRGFTRPLPILNSLSIFFYERPVALALKLSICLLFLSPSLLLSAATLPFTSVFHSRFTPVFFLSQFSLNFFICLKPIHSMLSPLHPRGWRRVSCPCLIAPYLQIKHERSSGDIEPWALRGRRCGMSPMRGESRRVGKMQRCSLIAPPCSLVTAEGQSHTSAAAPPPRHVKRP